MHGLKSAAQAVMGMMDGGGMSYPGALHVVGGSGVAAAAPSSSHRPEVPPVHCHSEDVAGCVGIGATGSSRTQHLQWSQPDRWQLPNGDRLPDFSSVGCEPTVMDVSRAIDDNDDNGHLLIVKLAAHSGGRSRNSIVDRTADIQQAIDTVSAHPLVRDRRGIVELGAGDYVVESEHGFRLGASGVIVRGSVSGVTRLVCTARSGSGAALFTIGAGRKPHKTHRIDITADYIPVGATLIPVANVHGLRVGDTISIVRVGNAAWISAIGMDRIACRPGGAPCRWSPFNLTWERKVVAVDGARLIITIDVGITTAIERRFGGGHVVYLGRGDGHPESETNGEMDTAGRIRNVGVEHLHVVCQLPSSIQRTLVKGISVVEDDQHLEYVVTVDNAMHCWVRGVVAEGFGFHTYVRGGAKVGMGQ